MKVNNYTIFPFRYSSCTSL